MYRFNVSVRNAAKKPVRYQTAFDFMPDLDETRVETLSILILFHRHPQRLTATHITPIRTRGYCDLNRSDAAAQGLGFSTETPSKPFLQFSARGQGARFNTAELRSSVAMTR